MATREADRPRMITADEAAAQLGVKLGTLYAYVSRGWLRSYRRRVGRQVLYRRDDIEATIDGLLADKDFRDVIDAKNIGAEGHSLGGYTVVGMAGGWVSWRDPRIRAVLALSPYVMPFEVHHTLRGVRVPLMYQGGTLDFGITPSLQGANGAYRQANPPAFFVELKNAGHLAWVNCGGARTTESCKAAELNIGLINEYGIAFFDAYLKHKTEPVLKEKDPALAAYDFKLE